MGFLCTEAFGGFRDARITLTTLPGPELLPLLGGSKAAARANRYLQGEPYLQDVGLSPSQIYSTASTNSTTAWVSSRQPIPHPGKSL